MKLNFIRWFHQFVPRSAKEKRQENKNNSDSQSQEKYTQNEFVSEKECVKEETLIVHTANDIFNVINETQNMSLQNANELALVEQTLELNQSQKSELPQLKAFHSSSIENNSPDINKNGNVVEKNLEIKDEHISVVSENSEVQPTTVNSEIQPNIVKSSWKYLSSVFIKVKTTIIPVQTLSQSNGLTGLPDSNASSLTDKVPKISINNIDGQLIKSSSSESNLACKDSVDRKYSEISLHASNEKYDSSFNSKSVSQTNLNDIAKLSPKNNLTTKNSANSTDSLNVDSASQNTRSILKRGNTEASTYHSMEKLNNELRLTDSINVDVASSGSSSIKVKSILKRRDEEDTHYNMDKLNNKLSPRELRRERRHSSVTFLEPENEERENILDMKYKELSLSANHKSTIISKKKKATAKKHNIGKYL